MDQKQIEALVRSVIATMGTSPAAAVPTPVTQPVSDVCVGEGCSLDLARRRRKPGLVSNIRIVRKC